MRQAERAKERRKSLLFIVLAVVVGIGLIAAAAIPALNSEDDPGGGQLASYGVSKAAANCEPVESQAVQGEGDHQPDGTRVEYEDVPPMFGPHSGSAEFPARSFYSDADGVPVEKLVHNLEHGYTVLWYDPSVSDRKVEVLQNIAEAGRQVEASGQKFVVAAWDDSYGEMSADYGLTHWGAEEGYRQMCGDISGDVVEDFLTAYPYTDSPEPNAG